MKRLNEGALAKAVETRARENLAMGNIGGISVLVAQENQVIYQGCFGTKDMKADPVTEETIFRIASMTKPITAVAAMILVERGLLSLEDRLDRFDPRFSVMRYFGKDQEEEILPPIKIEHLLTHTSGIGSGATRKEYLKTIPDSAYKTMEGLHEFLSKQALSFVPGTKQEYSGVAAFSLLTGIIQKVTDMPYEDFLKRELFEPCQMRNTTFEPSEAQWDRLIAMHDKQDGCSVIGITYEGCVINRYSTKNYLGGGGLISDARDYLNFSTMLLNGGEFQGRRILTEASIANMVTPRIARKEKEGWGLGVRVITEDGHLRPRCSFGWSGAFGTHFWIDPENQIVAIYLKNSRYDGGSGARTSREFEKDVYSAL